MNSEDIFNFFQSILNQESEVLSSLGKGGAVIAIEADNFSVVFTLPMLFDALKSCYAYESSESVSYKTFRSLLYAGTLNQDLKRLGYEISLFDSTGHVDSSRYQLTKCQ